MQVIAGRIVGAYKPRKDTHDYEPDGPLKLAKSQEESGVIAGYCFIALFCVGVWAGVIWLVRWAFGW